MAKSAAKQRADRINELQAQALAENPDWIRLSEAERERRIERYVKARL